MSCAYSASPKVLRECCRLTILAWYSLYAGEAKNFLSGTVYAILSN
jgi:hypothetical protein